MTDDDQKSVKHFATNNPLIAGELLLHGEDEQSAVPRGRGRGQ